MSSHLASVLSGAAAMASFAVTLFFLKFWRQTRDSFFLLFAFAFAVDAVTRITLGLTRLSNEVEPLFYCTRLATFALIIAAIVIKNRSRRNGN
jgi:uncharacterized membrane protein HdeD (DUF308 family)